MRRLKTLACLPLLGLLSACNLVVLNPAGEVAIQQRDLVVIATVLMLLIIIPVMILTVVFAWRYRAGNKQAPYDPDWDHSTGLELVIWAAPLLIVICLGAITWRSTHLLDPFRPLAAPNSAAGQTTDRDSRPVQVQAVALDWKWLFIYPDLKVAAVNELAVPVDRPVEFTITSSSVMNTFYVPAMAGMIYAMPAMQTKLHAVMNRTGDYEGISANFSGGGFSDMRFTLHSLDRAGFDAWVAQAQASPDAMDATRYLTLEKPSEREPVAKFGTVEDGLFGRIVDQCVEPGKMCRTEQMALNRQGGTGMAANLLPLTYDKDRARGTAPFGRPNGYLASICSPGDTMGVRASAAAAEKEPAPIRGAGTGIADKPDRWGALLPADNPAAAAQAPSNL